VISADDIDQVLEVQKAGNKYPLAQKVSHRRGAIIICKTYHRGRVILEMNSTMERDLLIHGFNRLLDDLNRFNPTLDDTGALRKRIPRRQSLVEFFDPHADQDNHAIEKEVDRRASLPETEIFSQGELSQYGITSIDQTENEAQDAAASAEIREEAESPIVEHPIPEKEATEQPKPTPPAGKRGSQFETKTKELEESYETRFDDSLEKPISSRRPELARGFSVSVLK
jgi:hypothetical protein